MQARYAYFLNMLYFFMILRSFLLDCFTEADHAIVAGEEKKVNGHTPRIAYRVSTGWLGFKSLGDFDVL